MTEIRVRRSANRSPRPLSPAGPRRPATPAVEGRLVELKTDKVTMEVPAPSPGMLADIAAKEGETVPSARCSATSTTQRQPPRSRPLRRPRPPSPPQHRPPPSGRRAVHQAPPADAPLAPSVRKISAETGIDAATVPGSGKDGRVTKGDMLAAMRRRLGADAAHSSRRPRSRAAHRRPRTTPRARSGCR